VREIDRATQAAALVAKSEVLLGGHDLTSSMLTAGFEA